jgi:hypothetical protein
VNSYVLCVRDVITDDQNGGVRFSTGMGKPSYLCVPWGGKRAVIPKADEPRPEHAMADVKAWLSAIVAEGTDGRKPGEELKVVFLVHGYNTDPAEALKRQRMVERELWKRDFPCLVIGFDWPTGGTAVAYLYDRHEAALAAGTLVSGGIFPFALFSTADCPIKVHVMAHSMGGYVIREAFRGADRARMAAIPNDWRIGQMVLFAADVSSSSFEAGSTDMLPVFDHCGRLTNYFSGYDEALAVSNVKNLDISSRVGRVGMPADKPTEAKALDVDCGPRYQAVKDRPFKVINGMASHSWYLEDELWYDDLAFTLKGGYDRNLIPTRTPSPSGIVDDFVLNASQQP